MKTHSVGPVGAPRWRTKAFTRAALLALAGTQLGGLAGSAAAQEVKTGGTLIRAAG
jgi:hypothetical protein